MLDRLRVTLEMIKFPHTVFALPFALLAALLARQGWPSLRETLLILLAMVGARSAAMAFNRVADRHYDALNPRTRGRALVTGELSLGFALAFVAASSALLLLAAWLLNPLAFKLSPLALAIHVTGSGNEVTALACATYFWARLIHAPFYIINAPYVRTAAWTVGLVACFVLAYQLLV